jgi:uncharacterized protein (DUF1697 family)
MTRRCVAFLRGINVGGRRITGPEMVGVATAAGFDAARSYQASGNLVFDTDVGASEVERRVSEAFAAARRWDVDVFVRSLEDLDGVVARLPFAPDAVAARGKPQVGFAHSPIDVSALAVERDLVATIGTEVYWVPHTGVSDADLDLSDFTGLASPVTFRTLGTIERIIAKFGD